jgi:hypothetical protein
METAMQSVLNLRFTLGIARGTARPRPLRLTKAIIVAEDLHARWEEVADRCGRAWTASQARKHERELRHAMAAAKIGGDE